MRKIQTQAEINKRKRNNQIVVGVVMVVLLVMSIAGYSLRSGDDDTESRVNEMGIDFVRQNGFWIIESNENIFMFQNLPSEISDVNVNISISLGEYIQEPLYFVNPNDGASEILNNIGNYVLRYQEACLENTTCEGDLPIKSCEDNLIIFEAGSSNKVYQDGNCIFIIGDSIRSTDAFLYGILQIL